MIFFRRYIRHLILAFSVLFALGVFIYVKQTIASPTLQIIRLTQIYALTATAFLYLALIVSPLYISLPSLPFKSYHLVARRAIGVSAFFFATLHATIGFFGNLGGFSGFGFLSQKYLLAIGLSFTAWLILAAMAATSFDFMVRKLGRKWKILHRLVYLAVVLITIHALMLGTHFQNLWEPIPQVFITALLILILLEAIRIDKFLAKKFAALPRFGAASVVGLVIFIVGGLYFLLPEQVAQTTSFGIHSQHIQLAEQANNPISSSLQRNTFPGATGDPTKRYTVSFLNNGQQFSPNEDINLSFRINEAANGSPALLFSVFYERPMHLIVVDSTLTYFNHIHPTQNGNEFNVVTQFPKNGSYRLYLDFLPSGAIEQQFAFTAEVGTLVQVEKSKQEADKNLTKVFGAYEVSLDAKGPLKASALSVGQTTLKFTVKDAKTKQPVTNLKPYLGTYAHLVMLRQESYDYVHVHPTNQTTPPPNSDFGPSVEFLPLGIYGPLKPGNYRTFAQFNVNGTLIVFDFTLKVD